MKKLILISLLLPIFSQAQTVQSVSDFSMRSGRDSLALQGASPKSMWIGAVLAYNFQDGGGVNNIVGAGKAQLGVVKQTQNNKYFQMFVVGNLSKISNSASVEDIETEITSIAQSAQGLSVAIAPVYTFNPNNMQNNFFRGYASVGGKFNAFSDVGTEKETITISQFRVTAGIEFEGLELDGGGRFNLSTEVSYSAFDEKNYLKVFGQKRSNILGWETVLIIPIGNNFGAMGSYTVATNSAAVIQAGIIVKR